MFNKVKGTHDILPDESIVWQKLEKEIRILCSNYNFKEIRLPVIEYTNVFTRSIGEETDIVSKEMYSFQSRGGKSITLRPEGTAGAVRSYVENKVHGQEALTRWFYFGPMFRAERPQKGRQRQFHQFGIELIGSESPVADAEVIIFNIMLFKRLGLKNVKLKINSVGDENSRPKYIENLKTYFSDKLDGLCEQCKVRYEKNILRMLDCKVTTCQQILNNAPAIEDFLDTASKEHFETVKSLIPQAEIEFTCDKRLVRGLDYYTRTAFEITSGDLGGQDAIAGGGRYDNLIESFGKNKIPAVGSALGMERLIIAYKSSGAYDEAVSSLDIYVTYFEHKHVKHAFSVLKNLRDHGLSADISQKAKKIGSQLKDADRLNSHFAVIIGDDEIKTGKYTLKDLKKGEQFTGLSLEQVITEIQKNINR